jgi:cytoskeletal protein RodZ
MPPPKKKSRTRLWLILAAVVLVLAVIIGLASKGQSQNPAPATQATQPTLATQQPTLQPTTAPTTKPTSKSTVKPKQGLTATHGTPHLGGPTSDFVGAYGQPGPHSSIQPGLYDLHFLPSTSSNSNVDGLIVETDPGTTAYLAGNIIVQAQNGNAQTSAVGWAVNDAQARCITFAPSDAHFVKEFVYVNNAGFDIVYTSVELAREFPASAFTDSQGNQAQAGMFDVMYLYASDHQHVNSCDMIIGEQQTTN